MEVRRYESVVIFNPRLSEVQLKEEIKKVEGLLEKSNVTLSGVDSAGKKELAFEFQKQRFGYFVTFNYETTNYEAANELHSALRIADAVHKFQTHIVKTRSRKFKGNPRAAERSADDGADSLE
jgi:ribosomal protein S6